MLTRRPFANTAGLLVIVWIISIAGFVFPDLIQRGALLPRVTEQWWGIWTATFLHLDFRHLIANTTPLLLFLLLLQLRGTSHFLIALFLCTTSAGLGLWCFGRSGAHIGASGLVFALFGFFIANAAIRRGGIDILIALGVMLTYWGLIFGLLPSDDQISWDGHLFGLIGGVLTSVLLSRPNKQLPIRE